MTTQHQSTYHVRTWKDFRNNFDLEHHHSEQRGQMQILPESDFIGFNLHWRTSSFPEMTSIGILGQFDGMLLLDTRERHLLQFN